MKPPYSQPDQRVRGTSTYPPGAKENGSIFCHANTWAIVAAAQLGWVDRAYQYYRQILPFKRVDADVYMAEPYVYCQNISAPEHPQYGMGRNSWLTGTASWAYVAGTQWILGIRPTFEGLLIDPAIPSDWSGYKAQRIYRSVVYNLTVEQKGSGRRVSILVENQPIEGNIIPIPEKGVTSIDVKVFLE
jgi:cellobiose phosphorylase